MVGSLCGCLHLMCFGSIAAAVVRGDFAVGPSNQAVVAGRRMEMECMATNGSEVFKWTLTRTKSQKKEWICRKSSSFVAFQNFGCSVDEQGSVMVFKNSTDPRDAGIYFCHDFPEQNQFRAHLIVFESEPLCQINNTSHQENATVAKGDDVSMKCQVNFHGLWTPSVEWRRHTAAGAEEGGGNVVAGRDSLTVSSSGANLLSSSLDTVVTFDLPTYFSFRLFFARRDALVQVEASNLPEFRYEWRSPDMVPELPRIEPVRVQVVVETVTLNHVIVQTVTSNSKSAGDWYLVSLVLLVLVPAIVLSIAAIFIRRCYIGHRRNKGLDQRSMPAKTSFLYGLERPASGEYDVIPYAAPNIYDRIEDGGEPIERTADAQQHLPLTQCYSQLSDTSLLPADPYDALTPYLSMESPNTPGLCPLPEVPSSERRENRYTEMAKRGNTAAASTKDSYLTLVGEDEADARETTSASEDNGVSSEDASSATGRFAKTSGDYLIPFV